MRKIKMIMAFLMFFVTLISFSTPMASAATTLQYGSRGTEVVTLQKQLMSLGFYLGPTGADGVFGTYTLEAVKGVQSASGITTDGIVGDLTRSKLTYWLTQPAYSPYMNTAHFTQNEFRCRHCNRIGNGMSKSLLLKLEALRVKLGNRPITVTSGYRCPVYNSQLEGAAVHSQHMYNTAADIQVYGIAPSSVANAAETIFRNGGLGRYSSFTHVDVRGYYARW